MPTLANKKVKLIYIYDPMCSWCWGYRPTWLTLQQAIKEQLPSIEVNYLLGGLAPDSDLPMPADMQHFLQQTWKKIENQLGTKFNFDFWQDCQPRRSTYPACRACLIAREYGLEKEMYFAIQEAYYLQAKNPSDDSTLIAVAGGLGIDEALFSEQLKAVTTQQNLLKEIELAHSLPIRGFPSLVLNIDEESYSIPIDYLHDQVSLDAINNLLNE